MLEEDEGNFDTPIRILRYISPKIKRGIQARKDLKLDYEITVSGSRLDKYLTSQVVLSHMSNIIPVAFRPRYKTGYKIWHFKLKEIELFS